MVQTQTPLLIQKVAAYISQSGPMPFLIRHDAANTAFELSNDVKLKHESFDVSLSTYRFSYRSDVKHATDKKYGKVVFCVPYGGITIDARVTPVKEDQVNIKILARRVFNADRVVSKASKHCVCLWIEREDKAEIQHDVHVDIVVRGVDSGCQMNGAELEKMEL